MDVVPVDQANEKKLYGKIPISTNSGKFLREFGITTVKTKVNTAIITKGFTSDHKMPNDMLR
jgi:hypothetical protein